MLGAGRAHLLLRGRDRVWPLAALVVYLLACYCPVSAGSMAARDRAPDAGPRRVLADAGRRCCAGRRRWAFAGWLRSTGGQGHWSRRGTVMPLLTLTIAFTFLAAAHFAMPSDSGG